MMGETYGANPVAVCYVATMPAYILAIDQGTHASRALGPALSWQDRRAQAELYPFAESEKLVRHITGLPLSPHYGAGKIGWLLAHDRAVWAAAEDNRLCVGPLTSFLLWHLLETHDYCVDASNAHRMLLLDVRRASWSETFLELFQIGKSLLPKVLPYDAGIFSKPRQRVRPGWRRDVRPVGSARLARLGVRSWRMRIHSRSNRDSYPKPIPACVHVSMPLPLS